MPDPASITTPIWSDINQWLLYMGIYLIFIVTFAFSLLTALAIIPSLVSTGHLPAKVLKLRPPMIASSIVALIAAGSFLGLAIVGYQEFDDFWPRWWI